MKRDVDVIRVWECKDFTFLEEHQLDFRSMTQDRIEEAYILESDSYPEDEAATKEKLYDRQKHAGDFFFALFSRVDDSIVGFVCGTKCFGQTLEEETMSKHEPEGTNLCIHSVVVRQADRRKGIASAMLRTYIRRISLYNEPLGVNQSTLICKDWLIGFYKECGFIFSRPSPVVHGSESWFEMYMDMDTCTSRYPLALQVNSFCDFSQPRGSGNPAAVVLSHGSGEKWMQKVALDMNLSETSFVTPKHGARDTYHLRWFSPSTEVNLCGHATLAAAHILWEVHAVERHCSITFSTLSGDLICNILDDGSVEMDFPIEPVEMVNQPTKDLIQHIKEGVWKPGDIMGSDLKAIYRNRLDVFVVVSEEAFDLISKNGAANLSILGKIDTRGVVVTCAYDQNKTANHGYDIRSRFFAPRLGINEDPVTGSAHCGLISLWANQLGKKDLCAYQSSQRGGVVRVRFDEQDQTRCKIVGRGWTSYRGFLSK